MSRYIVLTEPVPIVNIHGSHRDNFGNNQQYDKVHIVVNPDYIKTIKIVTGSAHSTITFNDGSLLNVFETPEQILELVANVDY